MTRIIFTNQNFLSYKIFLSNFNKIGYGGGERKMRKLSSIISHASSITCLPLLKLLCMRWYILIWQVLRGFLLLSMLFRRCRFCTVNLTFGSGITCWRFRLWLLRMRFLLWRVCRRRFLLITLWFTRHWFWTLVFIGRRVIHWSIFVRTEYQVLHDIFIQSYLFLVLCFSLLLFLLLLGRFSPVNQGRVVQINNLPWQGSN